MYKGCSMKKDAKLDNVINETLVFKIKILECVTRDSDAEHYFYYSRFYVERQTWGQKYLLKSLSILHSKPQKWTRFQNSIKKIEWAVMSVKQKPNNRGILNIYFHQYRFSICIVSFFTHSFPQTFSTKFFSMVWHHGSDPSVKEAIPPFRKKNWFSEHSMNVRIC